MIYLDYSATTPVSQSVLEQFNKNTLEYFANPNSKHALGRLSLEAIEKSEEVVKKTLDLETHEVIYTSGATEANNLAIKGYCMKHQSQGKHVIVSPYEHSSVVSSFSYLSSIGFDVDIIESSPDGRIRLEQLKEMIHEDTIFVSIAAINSETGVTQDIEGIASFLKQYPNIAFHTDATQAIGKKEYHYQNVDFVSLAAHKFYGFKGIGCLLRNKNVTIETQIHGGHSLSTFRSGTPATPLILSLSDALIEITKTFKEDLNYVLPLNSYLQQSLRVIPKIIINSNQYSVPHILNLSVIGHQASDVQEALSQKDIYISTQSACSQNSSFSQVIYKMTGNEDRARSSVRISLSKRTTKEELEVLIQALKEVAL